MADFNIIEVFIATDKNTLKTQGDICKKTLNFAFACRHTHTHAMSSKICSVSKFQAPYVIVVFAGTYNWNTFLVTQIYDL